VSESTLAFHTLALRRELPSDHTELAPVTAPAIVAYGAEGRTSVELALALSELPTETRPTRSAMIRSSARVRCAGPSRT